MPAKSSSYKGVVWVATGVAHEHPLMVPLGGLLQQEALPPCLCEERQRRSNLGGHTRSLRAQRSNLGGGYIDLGFRHQDLGFFMKEQEV